MNKSIKNTHREAPQSKKRFKVIVMSIFFIFFLVGSVSALEIDNVKSYNLETKTITITNAFGFGDDIAEIQLKTPLDFRVPRGYQKVAEFEVTSYNDYSNAFKELELYDKKNGDKKFSRDFDYKALSYETVNADDYGLVNVGNFINGSIKYETQVIGSHEEQREVWTKLTPANFKKDEVVTIGIFTEVEKDDFVEWIPNFFGIRINEWASWTADLNVDLLGYWDFNEANSGDDALDLIGSSDGVCAGCDRVAGKIGNSVDLDGASEIMNFSNDASLNAWDEFTISVWLNFDENTKSSAVIGKKTLGYNAGTGWGNMWLGATDDKWNDYSSGVTVAYSIANIPTNGVWYHYVFRWTGGGHEVIRNNVNISTTAGDMDISPVGDNVLANFMIGFNSLDPNYYNGQADELGIWNRSLTDSEISDLYNGGTGIVFQAVFINITLNSPVNEFNSSSPLINFNGTVHSSTTLVNVSLYVNGTLDQTNSSGINNTNYLFSKTVAEVGSYNWTYESCDTSGDCFTQDERNFTYSNDLNVTLNSPENDFRTNQSIVIFNGTASDDIAIINVSLYINGILNETNSSGINNTDYLFNITFSDGVSNWTYESCDSIDCLMTEIRNFTVHTIPATIEIFSPNGTINYHRMGDNLTLSWNISEGGQNLTEHIQNCSYIYNSVEVALNQTFCIDLNQTSFLYVQGIDNLTFIVLDLFNITTTALTTWDYIILENSLDYENETIGGSVEDFELNITKDSSLQISMVSLVYNLSSSTATFSSGNNPIISKSLNIPNPSSDTNFSFYFSFTMSDSSIINTSSNNQTVLNLNMGNCSSFSTLIYNFTMLDEENQTSLSNTTIEYAFNLFDGLRTNQIINISFTSTDNPTSICLNKNLTSTSSYSLDGVLKYVSEQDSYLTRYYNILNFSLINSSIPNNVSIYDVLDTIATPFQLTFRNSLLVLTPDILVNVNKQYVSSDDFKTVEIPITDTDGQTIVNLVRNTAIYNFILIDSAGNILASFNNKNAFCQDFTIGECSIFLDAPSTVDETFNLGDSVGMSYNIEYVNSTSIATLTFSSLNSTAITTRIVGKTQNQFGNRSVCDSSLTSTLGTISCNASSILATDNFLFIDVFTNGNYVGTRIININPTSPLIGGLYGSNGFFIAFLMLLIIILTFSDDKQVLLIMIGLGWVTVLIFGLIKGAIIGSVSGGIWLIVSIIIMLWKIKQEEGQP